MGADGHDERGGSPPAGAGPAAAPPTSGARRLRRRAVTRPWGGQRIAPAMGWPDAGPVGEWWLLSCHPAAVTEVEPSGPLPDGTPFDAWLDGTDAPPMLPDGDAFPLLLKFLDADEVLSVQVHPDDRTARQHGLRHGKTEAWHVLAAEPDACLYLGTAPGVRPAALLDAVARGAGSDEVTAMLRRVPAVPGETWMVEAGTIHAIGPGVTLFEVQQTSDATWRIYDWERQPPRPLHLEQARVAVKDRPMPVPVAPPDDAPGWTPLAACHAFALEHGRVAGTLALPADRGWAGLTVLAGEGALLSDDGERPLKPGDTLLTWGGGSLRGDALCVLLSRPAG